MSSFEDAVIEQVDYTEKIHQKIKKQIGTPQMDYKELMSEEDILLHKKCQTIMMSVDKVIGRTTMNPEVVLKLRENTKDMCELKYEM